MTIKTTTLCLLIRETSPAQILLGHKRIGFGAGKWGGFGGKVEAGETIAQAAARELEEETSIRVHERDLQQVGHLTFLFPHKPAWSQVVHVFLVLAWDGEPTESDEITPSWFPVNHVPYDQMWQDCRHWLPHILGGERIQARFTFQADNETVDTAQIATLPAKIGVWGLEFGV